MMAYLLIHERNDCFPSFLVTDLCLQIRILEGFLDE